jgi:hypothetical protein
MKNKILEKRYFVNVCREERICCLVCTEFFPFSFQGPAMALKQDVQSSSNTLKDRLSIETQPDFRRANVRYGNQIFHGKVRHASRKKSFYQVIKCRLKDVETKMQLICVKLK